VVISTQSNDPEHILSKLIDDGVGAKDPRIVCHLYEVPEDCKDIFDPRVWKKANPALGDFRSLADLKAIADKAERMPAEEPKFRNLYLNQRVAPTASLISRKEWMACVGPAEFAEQEEVYLALDMSAVVDLTALVMGSAGDKTKIRPFIWKPEELLSEHSNRDFGSGNDRYSQWHKQGHLLVSPGRTIDPAVVALKLRSYASQYRVLGLAYDRWRIADLLREFDRIGFAAWEDKGGDKPGSGLRLIPWGQGFKDMAPAIDALEIDVIERKIEHPSNPVLTWNMANAVATMDPAGNRKLDKDKARFRIDAAVALTMLCGLKSRDRKKDTGAALNRAILERRLRLRLRRFSDMGLWGRIFGGKAKSTSDSPASWFIDWVRGGDSTTAGVHVTPDSSMRLSAVWACVRIRSEDVGKLPCFCIASFRMAEKSARPIIRCSI
jgi:phage terminase large subunit-like protein